MTTRVPEMMELYRRLLEDLTAKFGGSIDEANADAIAYAAADLYHRDMEPRLWAEKSAHDLLDLFGVPRAGVFAPYSLTERLVVLQRRACGAENAARAHEVLDALEVPAQDQEGNPQPLSTRLKAFLGEASTAGGRNSPEPAEDDTGPEPAAGTGGPDVVGGNGTVPAGEAGGGVQPEGEEVAHVEPGDHPEGEEVAGEERPFETVTGEEAGVEVTEEPGAAPLVDAIRALERAARVEAQLSEGGVEVPGGLDLVNLNATMSGIQAELVALRTLLESLGTELRESIRALQEELLEVRAGLGPEPVPAGARAAGEVTQVLPPVPGDDTMAAVQAESTEEAPSPIRRPLRRVLLVVLLILLGLVLAGVIVLAVVYGWHLVNTEIGAVTSSRPEPRRFAAILTWPCPAFPLPREERPIDLCC